MLDLIQTRLRDQVADLKLVDGAAAFQVAAENNPKAAPAAYVLLLGERAGSNDLGNDHVEQRIASRIGIVIVTRNVADPKGAAATTDMKALRLAVRTALLGWQPAADHDGLERGESALLAFKDGFMWWQDTYLTAHYERSY